MSWREHLGESRRTPLDALRERAFGASLALRAGLVRGKRGIAGPRSFSVGGQPLRYVISPYNATWRNERAVEIAIARQWLQTRPNGELLEIGHVLGHYGISKSEHTVVDLYETAPGVVNADALTFNPGRTFPSIIAVSTLEHVGFDEEDQDPTKARALVDHLASLLAPGGELLVTFPIGYQYHLDQDLVAGRLGFDDVAILRRVSARGDWEEAALSDVPRIRYGFPFHWANGIAVGQRRAPLS